MYYFYHIKRGIENEGPNKGLPGIVNISYGVPPQDKPRLTLEQAIQIVTEQVNTHGLKSIYIVADTVATSSIVKFIDYCTLQLNLEVHVDISIYVPLVGRPDVNVIVNLKGVNKLYSKAIYEDTVRILDHRGGNLYVSSLDGEKNDEVLI